MDSVDTSRKKRNGRKQGVLFKLFKHGVERRGGGWGRQLADNLRTDCFTRVKCKQWITSEIFARKHTEHSTRRVGRNLLVTVHYITYPHVWPQTDKNRNSQNSFLFLLDEESWADKRQSARRLTISTNDWKQKRDKKAWNKTQLNEPKKKLVSD